MTEEGVLRLKQAVEKHTHEQWSYLISYPVGTKSYKKYTRSYGATLQLSPLKAIRSTQIRGIALFVNPSQQNSDQNMTVANWLLVQYISSTAKVLKIELLRFKL